jgi:AraC-like DNA-binding protein
MDPRIKFVASFIRENYQRKLTLREMASAVNLSPWRLCHLFREEMHTSPQRFLTRVRLEKAQKLIATEFLTVKEVMNQVGMSDASSFARSFKAAFGVTPSQFKSAPKIYNSKTGTETERKVKAR